LTGEDEKMNHRLRREDRPIAGASIDPPDHIGAHVLEAFMAKGGSGVIYRARHVEHDAPAAIKILHAELATNPGAVARFEREVAVLQRLEHPNVVQIFDCGRLVDGRPYFIMELLRGVSLKQHLETRGRLSIDEALAILEPLCSAISAAHAQSIIHRDIKPSTIFLCDPDASPAASAGRLVLLDFGLAKLLDAEGSGLTSSRYVIGTLICMAPEQILSKPVDERTDIYALGVLTYRMLTGEPPFAARSQLAMQQMHLYSTPRPPSSLAPLSPALNGPVLRALSKEPSDRQPSVDVFFEEILSAAGRRRDTEERPTLAVYVDTSLDPEVAEDAREEDFADLEEILPAARAALAAAGFVVALETGSSLLLSRPLPDDPSEGATIRRAAALTLATFHRALERRPAPSDLVRVQLYLHLVPARIAADGIVVGGPMMELAAWLPDIHDIEASRPLVSTPALAGLNLDAHAVGAVGGVIWHELT